MRVSPYQSTILPFLVLVLMLCTSCSQTPNGKVYLNESPQFDLFTFFNGKTKAWGIVQNFSGDVVQRFTVSIDGTLHNDNHIELNEWFTYQQGGGLASRTWQIHRLEDGKIQGSAGDIAGMANGTIFGNAFQFVYEMDLPVDDTTYRVKFDDWMWMLDERTLINRSYIKKWGVTVAEVTLFMQKPATQQSLNH